MNKWMITSLLGGLLLSGTWTRAQVPAGEGWQLEPPAGGSVTVLTGTTAVPRAAAGGGGFAAASEGGRNVFIGGKAGSRQVPPAALTFQGASTYGPGWISATATMAGKTEKAAFLGIATARPSATLRSQLKLKAGLVVESVEAKSSAETAGLQVHDIIEKCDDQWLINPAQFVGLVRMYKPGETVTLTIVREGDRKKITAKLEERETYALADDEQDVLRRPGTVDFVPQVGRGGGFGAAGGGGGSWGAYWSGSGGTSGGGAVQRITTGALGTAPLTSGFVATFGDDKHQLLITNRDGRQILVVRDPNGKQIFEGPIDTPEQRKLLPPEALKKLEVMEKLQVKIRAGAAEPGARSEAAPAP